MSIEHKLAAESAAKAKMRDDDEMLLGKLTELHQMKVKEDALVKQLSQLREDQNSLVKGMQSLAAEHQEQWVQVSDGLIAYIEHFDNWGATNNPHDPIRNSIKFDAVHKL